MGSSATLCKRGWPESNRPVEHGSRSTQSLYSPSLLDTAASGSSQEKQVSGSLEAHTGLSGCLEVWEDSSLNHPLARGRSGDHTNIQASCSTIKSNTAPSSSGRQFVGYLRVGKQLPSDEVDTTNGQTEGRSEAALAPAKGNISNDKSDYLAENVTDGSNARGLPLHGVYPPRWEVGIEVWRPRDGEDGAGLRPGHHDDPKPVCDTSTRVDGPAARSGSLDQQ